MVSHNEVTDMVNKLRKEYIPFEIDKLCDQFALFLDNYKKLSYNERINIRNQFGPQHGAKILRCAQEFATRAVRFNNSNDILLGLMAIALEGIQSDFRDAVIAMCLLHHSAKKMSIDPIPLFQQAVTYGNNIAHDFMLKYLQNGNKDIGAMGMEEGFGPNGFDYITINV